MKLPERNERKIICADCGLESLPVFQDCFAIVPIGESQVKNMLAGSGDTGAAVARAESVDQPGKFFEWGEFQNLYAAHSPQRPRRGNRRTRLRWWGGFAGKAADPRGFGGAWHHVSIIASVFQWRR